MSHFAKIVNGRVETIIVAEQDFIDTQEGDWVQTSYNTRGGIHYDPETNKPSIDQSKALRKNYAHIGSIYDKKRDAFYSPQPFKSWSFNEDTCHWQPPINKPNDGNFYKWDEDIYKKCLETNSDLSIAWVKVKI